MAPSSLVKLMTAYVFLEALRSKRFSLEQRFSVSRKAARMGGSRMGLRAGDKVRAADLLRGIIVGSGNDASVVVAETLAGSETAFARQMTARARVLGLRGSRFKTATGFTRPGQHMTARDVARLAALTIRNFPKAYRNYGLRLYRYGGKVIRNRNPVLGRVRGADGLKTGQTRAGGYGLAASAVRNGRRLILVINGLPSEAARAREAVRLLEWGFRQP